MGVVVALASSAVQGAPIVIDDFEVGPFTVSPDLPADSVQLPTYFGPEVFAGRRTGQLHGYYSTATLAETPEDDSLRLIVSAPRPGDWTLHLQWTDPSGNPSVDFSSQMTLRVSFSAAPSTGRLEVAMLSADENSPEPPPPPFVPLLGYSYGQVRFPILGPGDYDFPLSSFCPVDLTDVDEIDLLVRAENVSDVLYEISQVIVIPEPSTAFLLGMGLVGLATRRVVPAS